MSISEPAGPTALDLAMKTAPARARVAPYQGRPTIWVDDRPLGMAAYSPVAGRRPQLMREQSTRFFSHGMDAYLLSLTPAIGEEWGDGAFWVGNDISDQPLLPMQDDMDDEAAHLIAGDPGAYFIVRFDQYEPLSWRRLNPDELAVTEEGEALAGPSLASAVYNQCSEQMVAAVVRYCESRPWAHRIIGYWSGHRYEGSHQPPVEGWLYDHGPRMNARWNSFLQETYPNLAALRAVYGPDAEFGRVPVPTDPMRGSMPEVASQTYWQGRDQNAPLRDYLQLGARLWSERFTGLARAMADQTAQLGLERVLVYDALKQPMQGWSNFGFFDGTLSWPVFYPDISAASGAMDVTPLFDVAGMDGLITPHDYQARGAGGVYEPEAAVDSCVLRGKLHLCEMDTRTWCGTDINFPARDIREFEAVTWRNLATSWTRGFHSYWMDLYQDWFVTDAIHEVIEGQVRAQHQVLGQPHADVAGIAVIIDDTCVLETNGSGHILNEQVSWEWRGGLARCGVPFRLYLLRDLELDNFPEHRLFYFPNLYRCDAMRLDLLRRKVFGGGRVVLWGPGSGISDGETLSPEHATQLTGFDFDYLPVNDPRRVQITNFAHSITQDLEPDLIYGSPTAYGPVLFPQGGVELGRALAKGGRDRSGLALKTMASSLGEWHSVFTTAAPLPAALWRELARFGGAHVYSEVNDVVLASRHLVALHSLKSGARTLALPAKAAVRDVVNGADLGALSNIEFDLQGPATHVFQLGDSQGDPQ